jgi:hypothetical protein
MVSPVGKKRWIEEAKRPTTRDRRIAATLERVRDGKPPR